MEFEEEFIFLPKWDYQLFFTQNLLTDCEIRITLAAGSDEYEAIRAHRAILSNGSKTFYNIFTAGMVEQETGIVKELRNPMNLLPDVIGYLYSGQLPFTDDKVMSLLTISLALEVDSLTKLLAAYITGPDCANADSLLDFLSQCYANELPEGLEFLEPVVAANYARISMGNMTQALDVEVFAHVLKRVDMRLVDKVMEINAFLGDYQCNEKQRKALSELFVNCDANVKKVLAEKGKKWWIPE
jgi:hypothetical protein